MKLDKEEKLLYKILAGCLLGIGVLTVLLFVMGKTEILNFLLSLTLTIIIVFGGGLFLIYVFVILPFLKAMEKIENPKVKSSVRKDDM